jgi:membrane protease YdiL (CAAX protease family)
MPPAGPESGRRQVPPPEVPGHGEPGHEAPQPTWQEIPASGGQPEAGRRPSRAASPGDPFYLPKADWRWRAAVAGLVAGAAPQALLEVASLFSSSTSTSASKVTAGSAITLAFFSLVLYSWQAFAAWLFSLRKAGRALVLWGFRRPTRAYFWVVPAGLAAVYAFSIAHDALVHPHQQAIVSEFPHSVVGVVMFVAVAVVMAPIFEEIVFRGFLFRGLSNSFGWVWGALISAAVFGGAHLQLDVFLPLAALGFILAWAYHRTGSLWTNITMHALFNAIAVLAWALTS